MRRTTGRYFTQAKLSQISTLDSKNAEENKKVIPGAKFESHIRNTQRTYTNIINIIYVPHIMKKKNKKNSISKENMRFTQRTQLNSITLLTNKHISKHIYTSTILLLYHYHYSRKIDIIIAQFFQRSIHLILAFKCIKVS